MISPYVYPGLKYELLPKKTNRNKIKHEIVMKVVAEHMNVTVDNIMSKSREQEYVEARHIYCGILRLVYGYTLKVIGRTINRDHTTAINAVVNFKNRCELEDGYQLRVNSIVNNLDYYI
jgi:chromosomal replication initiator protein